MSAQAIPSADDIFRSLNPDASGAQPAAPPTPPPTDAAPSSTGAPPDADAIYKTFTPDTPKTPDKPKGPPPPSLQDFVVRQLPHSLKTTASNIWQAISNNDDRLGSSVQNVIQGAVQNLYRKAGFELAPNEADQATKAVVEYYKNRYGGGNLGHTAYTDPIGTALDASTVLTLGGSGMGAVADAAEVANATRAAEIAGTVGKVATRAGEFTNPATWAPKALGWVADKFKTPAATTPAATQVFNPKTASFESYTGPVQDAAERAAQQQAEREAINQRAYDIAGIRPGSGVFPSQDDWIRAETEIRNKPPVTQQAGPTPAAQNPIYGKIRTALTGAGLAGAGLEYLAHNITGAIGGTLMAGAVHFLPIFLKTAQGQQLMAGIAQGANVADKAAQFVPALNAAYAQYQQQQKQKPVDLSTSPYFKAKGGAVNPELARIQRERLQLPGILGMLGK